MGATFELGDLAVDRGATINWHGAQSLDVLAEAVHFLTDLNTKFAGRGEDQHLSFVGLEVDHLQCR